MEQTLTVRVLGTLEILGLTGWETHVVTAYSPESDGYAYQLVGEEPGWLPVESVRNFVPAGEPCLPLQKSRADRLDALGSHQGIVRLLDPEGPPVLTGGNETDADLRARLRSPGYTDPRALDLARLAAR